MIATAILKPRLTIVDPSGQDVPQYEQALKTANRHRLAHADYKRAIAAGQLSISDVLCDLADTPELHSITISELLEAQWRWGKTHTLKFLAQIPMSEAKHIGTLTDRQRAWLAKEIDRLNLEVQARRKTAKSAKKAAVAQPLSVVPKQTRQQRLEALEIGNQIRMRRAKLKKEIKFGRCSPVPILESPEEFVFRMKVHDLVMAVPKVGKVKCGKLLSQCGISPRKTIGGLSGLQRSELIAALQSSAWKSST